MTTQQFTSTTSISASAAFDLIQGGMTVEYSDPANDMDSGNFAKVVAKDLDVFTKANGRLANRWLVLIELCNGRKETISAGQILAYAK
jgi:hypothetical protein